MKKRIMDLTEEEVKEICEEHDDFCRKYGRFRCPLYFKIGESNCLYDSEVWKKLHGEVEVEDALAPVSRAYETLRRAFEERRRKLTELERQIDAAH